MKILAIHAMTGASPEFIEREREIFARYAPPDMTVDIYKIPRGSQSIESHFDEYLGSIEVFKAVKDAEKKGYDGIIITCFANACVEPAREITHLPVIGSGMATMSVANLLGHNFGLILAKESSSYRHKEWAAKLGMAHKLVTIQRCDFSVLGLIQDPEATKRSFLEAARRAVDAGADVIFPGCFGLIGMADAVRDELPVPVVDPAGAALGVIETMVRLKVGQSKLAYPYPPEKRRDYDTGYEAPKQADGAPGCCF
ncbi:MAG: hypothetical protein H0Z37_06335 [Firmicutes bacterium]|nr:hypothetical protein [Bacillota bacterium]